MEQPAPDSPTQQQESMQDSPSPPHQQPPSDSLPPPQQQPCDSPQQEIQSARNSPEEWPPHQRVSREVLTPEIAFQSYSQLTFRRVYRILLLFMRILGHQRQSKYKYNLQHLIIIIFNLSILDRIIVFHCQS